MSGVMFLIPISIGMGLVGLAAFLWSLRHDQFEDLDGDAERLLAAPDRPINPTAQEKIDGEQAPGLHRSNPNRAL